MNKRIIVAITGASGIIYGITLLKALKKLGVETHLIVSDAAWSTLESETNVDKEELINLSDYYYQSKDIGASLSSGSFKVDGMIVCPCTVNTLAKIANGLNDNLISRSADVQLKEKRKLILVFRETPYNLTHIQNMEKVTLNGGIIFPPVPAFYCKPKVIDDIVNQTVGRVLDLIDIDTFNFNRWIK